MGLELTTDKYPPITSQMRYPLRHAASFNTPMTWKRTTIIKYPMLNNYFRCFRRARTDWSNFLNRSPERFNIRIPELPSEKDQRFVGYAVRYLRPEVTRSWKVSAHALSVTCYRTRVKTNIFPVYSLEKMATYACHRTSVSYESHSITS